MDLVANELEQLDALGLLGSRWQRESNGAQRLRHVQQRRVTSVSILGNVQIDLWQIQLVQNGNLLG